MDFDAVKRASGADLVECAIAAVANGRGLLEDAEMLSLAGRLGRASALAVLAVEEVGKGVGMTLLSFLPQHMRRNREAGRLLEWHGLKLAGGIILALLPACMAPGPALVTMPRDELEQIVRETEAFTRVDGDARERGLYVDLDRHGRVRRPEEVTRSEVADRLAQARDAVAAASALLEPNAPARLSHPPRESVRFATALVTALTQGGKSRSPEAAGRVLAEAARNSWSGAASADAS